MSGTFKAYIVSGDESSVITYARHAITARRDGAHELMEDFSYVTCLRANAYDDLYPNGPTDLQKFNDGWWFSCSLCRHGRADCDSGMHSDGNFYCEKCVRGFTEMRSVRTPRSVEDFFGNDMVYSDGEWREVLPPVSTLPLPNRTIWSPYIWFEPYN